MTTRVSHKNPTHEKVAPLEVNPLLEDSCFNPFSDLFLSQSTRPAFLSDLDLRCLTPFQRALLATDGTVTKLIESYALEPVNILRLYQETLVLTEAHVELNAIAGAAVIAREVLLRGRYTECDYLYAYSLLLPARLTSEIRQGLENDEGGLGRILLNSQLENRRELLWYGRETPERLPSEIRYLQGCDFMSRTYRIIASGQPTMLIIERFPMV